MPTYNKFQEHEIQGLFLPSPIFPRDIEVSTCIFMYHLVFLDTHKHFSAGTKILVERYKDFVLDSSCKYLSQVIRPRKFCFVTPTKTNLCTALNVGTCPCNRLGGRAWARLPRCFVHKLIIARRTLKEGEAQKPRVRNNVTLKPC